VKILVPTVYASISGSTRVLLAAAKALAAEHDVVVRGPFVEADEPTSLAFPAHALNSPLVKLQTLPVVARLVAAEYANLRGRGFDVIYVHDGPSLYVYSVVAGLIGAKLICHVHLRGSAPAEFIRRRFAESSIHISDHCAAGEPFAIIRNPVAVSPIKREPQPDELVVVGSLSRRKNQLLAIDAFGLLRQKGFSGRLRLCGDVIDVDYVRETRTRVAEMGIEQRVAYEGFVRTQDYLVGASCLLMPSLHENQSLALIEAIAAEVPVVVSDIPAHRELVNLGCLPPEALAPLTPEGFAAGVRRAQQMRDTGKYAARVRDIFSTERFSAELTAFFRTIEQPRRLVA
jgi:glycosyltransferase involved in cell wall biosynthesis